MMMRFISYLEMFYSTFQRWKLIRAEGLAFSYILTSTLKYEEEEEEKNREKVQTDCMEYLNQKKI